MIRSVPERARRRVDVSRLVPLLTSEDPEPRVVIARRIQDAVDFARDRVLAHLGSPTEFPLPSDPQSLERALLANVAPGRSRKRDREVDAAIGRLRSTGAARTGHYGELAALDARSSQSTGDLLVALALPSPLPPADAQPTSAPRAAAVPGRVEVTLDELRCVEKTRHLPEIDLRDEMVVRAAISGIDVAGAAREADLGKFRDDDAKAVSPRPFLSMPVPDVNDPAAAVVISLDVVEKDRGNEPPVPVSQTLIDALVYGALGTAVTAGGAYYVVFGANGAVVASGVTVLAPVAFGVFAVITLIVATVIAVKIFRKLGVDEAYESHVEDPLLLVALPGGGTRTTEFVATRGQDGFTGHYRLTWHVDLVGGAP